MRLGIMQPYFFPYLGYFSLIKHTDKFILFDPVQFIRHGWIERNRTLKQNEGWQYIQAPLVKYSQDTLIKDIEINNSTDWKGKILAQLQHYKKKSPYYFATIKVLNDIFSEDFNDIVSFNYVSLKKVCEYIGINTPIEIFSKMNLEIEPVNAPDEWALNICKAIGNVDEYWNPIGGTSFFDRDKYVKNNLILKFQNMKLDEYNQNRDTFEPGLSIIDVMMFNSPEEINRMLDNYELV
ncbi:MULTISPECIES: WbqC family protein [unclassified Dysgonomonas]|uniref:WbqC family protein n=1 Tax=unclassified Dysgonomonas TaxID=2630389 RepID=UPI001C8864FB|nr:MULTISPECIES: WbqC family protein [unclassified Dysgonomonas]